MSNSRSQPNQEKPNLLIIIGLIKSRINFASVRPRSISIRQKILRTIALKSALMFVALLAFCAFEKYQAEQLRKNDCLQSASYFNSVVASDQGNAWQDIASNQGVLNKSSQMNVSWLFNSAGKVTHTSTSGMFDLAGTQIPSPQYISELIKRQSVLRCYAPSGTRMLDLLGTPFMADVKPGHTKHISGYLIEGRICDSQYLSALAQASYSKVSLVSSASQIHPDSAFFDYETTYLFNCNDWIGKPIYAIEFTRIDPGLACMRTIALTSLGLLIVFGAVNLFIVSVCLVRWVSEPIEDIVGAVKCEDTTALEPLLRESTELGDMARVVEDFLSQQQQLRDSRDMLEMIVQERTSELELANEQLSSSYEAVIAGWGHALDIRDHETEGHCMRVTTMTMRLASHFGFNDDELLQIERGSLLHDIGKMGVPDSILLKEGELTADERELMKRHTQYAYDMLFPIEFLRPALSIPFSHHEKWDGSGYPDGLKGDQIPLAARIFAVADVADALLSNRPYRKAWGQKKVREHIQKLSGTHFDPKVVSIYLAETASEQDVDLRVDDNDNDQQLRIAA